MNAPARPAGRTALVDLVSVEAQISVPTQELLDALVWVRDHPSEAGSFSLTTVRGQLVIRLFTWGERRPRGPHRACSSAGRLPRRLAADRRDVAELCGANFYDRSTTLTVSDGGESLYIGKYWVWLYGPDAAPSAAVAGTTAEVVAPLDEELVHHIKALDAEHLTAPPASISELARRYERDTTLVGLLKRLRGPHCQICGGTFRTKDGGYFSECHHLESLAKDGLDVSSNILVLCPSHHAQFHHGEVAIKLHTADQVTVEIDGVEYTCAVGPRRSTQVSAETSAPVTTPRPIVSADGGATSTFAPTTAIRSGR